MNPALLNILFMLVMMQISRRIDMENPETIRIIRGIYLLSMLSAVLLFRHLRSKVIAKNDLTELKIVSPKNPMKPNEPQKIETTTVKDYDLKEIENAIKSLYSGMAMMVFMHMYLKFNNPLFMQCLNPIKSFLEHNETKIHLYGKPAVGPLKRPFKAPSLLGSMLGVGAGADADGKEEKPKIEEITEEEEKKKDVVKEGVKAE